MDIFSTDPVSLLIVDDDNHVVQRVSSCFPPPQYHCTAVESATAAMQLVRSSPFALILCGIRLADRDGMELLRQSLSRDRATAFLILGEHTDWALAVEAIRLGAYDWLPKSLRCDQLVDTVHRALERRQHDLEQEAFAALLQQTLQERTEHLQQALQQLEESHRSMLETLVVALDAREHETKLHSLRVQSSTSLLAEKCGYSRTLMRSLQQGALLHDIGKIAIPDAILLKPGKLTPEETQTMQQHPGFAYQILSRIPHLRQAATIALCHHERVDGNGYPLKLTGDAIPLAARIFAVADTLDAITAGRRYCPPRTLEEARQEILRCADTQFDRNVVDVFLSVRDEEWLDLHEEVALRYESLYQTISAPPALLPLPF